VTDEIEAFTDSDLAMKIVLLKTLADLVLDEFKAAKAIAADQYPKGLSISARTDSSDGDVKLGKVSKSDPKPVAEIVDRDELDDYIRAEYPDKLEHNIRLGDLGEILAILKDLGREDLFTEIKAIPEYLHTQMLTAAVGGRPIPGVALRRPAGVVSATKERAAVEMVRRLLSGAPVQLLGIEA
jgi:hypothetical protein